MIAPADLNKLVTRIAVYDDAFAYKELFLRYHARLVSFAATITLSRESAEEVVSDVFLKLWTIRTTLTRVANPHLYIYITTKNLSINRLQKEKREAVFSIDDAVVDIRSSALDPEQLMMTAEMRRRLQAAIDGLPPRCRLVFKLVKEDGLRYREVAELLGLSEKTVENQMTIALRRMGQSMRFDLSQSALN